MVPSVGEGPGLVILRKQARAVSEIGFIANLLAFCRALGYNQTFSGINYAKTWKNLGRPLQNSDTTLFPENSVLRDNTYHASNTSFCHILAKNRTKNGLKLLLDPQIWIHQPRAPFVQNKVPNQFEIWGSQVIQFNAVLNIHSVVNAWGTVLEEIAPTDCL